MYQPTHVDGCSLVVLQWLGRFYAAIDLGTLCYDGETLMLSSGRCITDNELGKFQSVVEGNRIPGCVGFDLFVVSEDAE